MKVKNSRKHYIIGISSTIGLASILLGVCSPLLVSCNGNNKVIETIPETNQPISHPDKLSANYKFTNCLANNAFFKTLEGLFTEFEKNTCSLKPLIKTINSHQETIAMNLFTSSKTMPMNAAYNYFSNFYKSKDADDPQVKYDSQIQFATILKQYQQEPWPVLPSFECSLDTKENNKVIFKIKDNHFNLNNYNFIEYMKFCLVQKTIQKTWYRIDEKEQLVFNNQFNVAKAKENYYASINEIVDDDFNGRLDFLKSFKIIDDNTFSLTFPVVPTSNETYENLIGNLFKFSKFLPSQVTETALLNENFASCSEVLQYPDKSSLDIMNVYFKEFKKIFHFVEDRFLVTSQKIPFNYTFSIDLNDETCQRLYQKNFNQIKADFRSTVDYDEMFKYNQATPCAIKNIKITFAMKKVDTLVNPHIMQFTVDQIINFYFIDGSVFEYNCENENNTFGDNNKIPFLMDFVERYILDGHGKRTGDTIPLKCIKIDQNQADGLIALIDKNIREWTFDDLIYSKNAINYARNQSSPTVNPHYQKLIDDLNNYFIDQHWDIKITRMNSRIHNDEFNGTNLLWVEPTFYLEKCPYLIFPNQDFSYCYNDKSSSGSINTSYYELSIAKTVKFPTSVKFLDCKFDTNQILDIKNLITDTFKNIDKKITDTDIQYDQNGNVTGPLEIKNLIEGINSYVQKNVNSQIKFKLKIDDNYWENGNILETDITLVPILINDYNPQTVYIDLHGPYGIENVEIQENGTNKEIVFSNIKTSISVTPNNPN